MIGTTVSHYRILEHLGGGGMGVVYRAEDLKLKRTVALKFLPPEWSRDPDARERFMREARAASALDHSNICTVYEVDETAEGQLFIAMAFCDGETLKKKIERGPLPIDEAISYAIQVAEGLQRAHEAGIVHRDIKPANVIVTERDEVKVVDFGLAKLAGEFALTQTGSTVGTPHYMSPEQSKGDEVGPQTDSWSLGVVLYEMVTGQRPFRGESGDAVVHSILHEDPPRLRDLRPDAPPMLDRIVGRTLEKDPAKRYESIDGLLSGLRSLVAAEGETGLETSDMPSASARQRRWLRIAVPIVGALLLVAVAVLLWRSQRTPLPETPSEALPRIVVLPFENLGSPEDEYFADGITEEITSRLAAVSGLQVISRTSAMQYKEQRPPLPQIGEELDVGYVLEGTIRWDRGGTGHGRVRITPQLIRVADDSHLWSERYDRVLEDIFTVQSDIAEEVIAHLETTLLEPERLLMEARPTDNMEAYQAYLLGVQYGWSSTEERSVQLTVEMLERAVRLDPEFAVAHAVLSEAHSRMYHFRFDFTPERLEMARASAERAMDLQPGLPEGHRALGYYHYWGLRDYDRALAEFAKAARALPNDAEVLLGVLSVHRRQGRWDEALDELGRWQRVDPQRYQAAVVAEQTYIQLREYEKAEQELRRAIAIAPDLPDAYSEGSNLYVLWDGSTQRARRIVESAPNLDSPEFNYYSLLLDLYDRKPDVVMTRLEGRSFEAVDFQPCYVPRDLLLCRCLFDLGEVERGKAACASAVDVIQREMRARPDDFRLFIALGHAFSLVGRKEEAVRAGEHAIELVPVSKDALEWSDQAIELAKIYSRVGEADEALDLIEELLSIPCYLSVGLLRIDPVWDPLRDHPRFQEILKRYGHDDATVQ